MVTTEIVWNGVHCSNVGMYGVTVEGWPDLYIPERNITEQTIPGSNDPFLIDEGTYSSYNQKYTLHWRAEDDAAVEDWLFSPVGWCELIDSAKPEKFREAYIVGGHSMMNVLNVLHQCEVTFRCKPFWMQNRSYGFTFTENSSSGEGTVYEVDGLSGIAGDAYITIESGTANPMTKLVVWANTDDLDDSNPTLTITRSGTDTAFYKAEIDCGSKWVRVTTDTAGTVEYVFPAISYGWPQLGKTKDAFYGGVGIKCDSKSTSAKTVTVDWKECRVL